MRLFNYDLVKQSGSNHLPSDFEALHKDIYQKVASRTMTSPERIYSLIQAVKYIEQQGIEGAIVECGVW
ncbi:TylF/MycF/NovP-related O-methyltransferase, partial [Stenotrophomonas maltophilia]|uniref:TylF/MycF/NovP-related O-methyltransferase n=1 Tax=Stenotrophomonas maltophilia TaxID=40324 RepID=UPI001954DE1E